MPKIWSNFPKFPSKFRTHAVGPRHRLLVGVVVVPVQVQDRDDAVRRVLLHEARDQRLVLLVEVRVLGGVGAARLPVDPLVSTWGVERRGEFSPLGPLASCFLALGSGLGLDGTVSARR